jgi:hypothetical protein
MRRSIGVVSRFVATLSFPRPGAGAARPSGNHIACACCGTILALNPQMTQGTQMKTVLNLRFICVICG